MRQPRFILIDIDPVDELRDRVLPVILDIPHDIALPSGKLAKELVIRAANVSVYRRQWAGRRKLPLSEDDACMSPTLDLLFQSVDWHAAQHVWLLMPDTASEAFDYVSLVGPSPSVEHLLAKDPRYALAYAIRILRSPFPDGEKAIGQDADASVEYAERFKQRVLSGEERISADEGLAERYGNIMKKNALWETWTVAELSRSVVWIFQYAKDHIKGRLPDELHNQIMLECSSPWQKRYFQAQKYR